MFSFCQQTDSSVLCTEQGGKLFATTGYLLGPHICLSFPLSALGTDRNIRRLIDQRVLRNFIKQWAIPNHSRSLYVFPSLSLLFWRDPGKASISFSFSSWFFLLKHFWVALTVKDLAASINPWLRFQTAVESPPPGISKATSVPTGWRGVDFQHCGVPTRPDLKIHL